jgi:pimeloyl-ACP methyl ester carboxylesterase
MEAESAERGKEIISHFVLVHGACHGAWCWYKLSDLLKNAGHVVTAVDLGGAGLNPNDGEAIRSLAEYNEPLARFMKALPHGDEDGAEKDAKVILVGHSMGGVNLTCMMEQFPHKIAAAVFVTAFMPVPGTTPLQLINQVYERNKTWGDTEFKYGLDGQSSRPTSFKFGSNFAREYLYHNSPSQDITLAERLLRSMPVFDEAVIYSSENYGRVPRAFIVAKQDKAIWEELQRKMIADNPPDRVYELEESDHSPFFSCPARLARILQEISSHCADGLIQTY